jgi:hypothetical protein
LAGAAGWINIEKVMLAAVDTQFRLGNRNNRLAVFFGMMMVIVPIFGHW